MYVVIYSSAGCLPDSEAWIVDNEQEYLRPETDHDLYSLELIPV